MFVRVFKVLPGTRGYALKWGVLVRCGSDFLKPVEDSLIPYRSTRKEHLPPSTYHLIGQKEGVFPRIWTFVWKGLPDSHLGLWVQEAANLQLLPNHIGREPEG